MSVTNKTIERLDCFSLVFGQNIVKQYRAFVYTPIEIKLLLLLLLLLVLVLVLVYITQVNTCSTFRAR